MKSFDWILPPLGPLPIWRDTLNIQAATVRGVQIPHMLTAWLTCDRPLNFGWLPLLKDLVYFIYCPSIQFLNNRFLLHINQSMQIIQINVEFKNVTGASKEITAVTVTFSSCGDWPGLVVKDILSSGRPFLPSRVGWTFCLRRAEAIYSRHRV